MPRKPFLLLIFLAVSLANAADMDMKTYYAAAQALAKLPRDQIQQKAEGGDSVAKFVYANILRSQDKKMTNRAVVSKYLREAAEAGVPLALYQISQEQRLDGGDFIRSLERAAQCGLASAASTLAREYLEATNIPHDDAKGIEWLRKALEGGDPWAAYKLAELYAGGRGKPRNPSEEPLVLLNKAAQRGLTEAMAELGRRYRAGDGIERDFLQAAIWHWRSGSSSGVPEFLDRELQPRPRPGWNDELKQFAQVLSLYARANVEQDPEIMRKVGIAFLKGEGGKPDLKTAAIWLGMAADSGDAEAAKVAQEASKNFSEADRAEVQREVLKLEGKLKR
jgi:TPR repeat protein